MEMIFAILLGVVIGGVLGFVLSKLKNQGSHAMVEKLQWQLENEKANAEQQVAHLTRQVQEAKAEANELLDKAKAEFDLRLAEAKADAEKQAKELLEAQDVRHAQALQTQKQHLMEAKELVEKQAKDMLEAQELRHDQALRAQQERLLNAEKQAKELLEAQEVRYEQTLQTQKQHLIEAKVLVEKQAKEMLEAQEQRHRQALEVQQERLEDAEKQAKEMLAAQERNHEQALKAQQARFDEVMEKVSAQVKTATEDMLKQRQKEFAESSTTNLGQIVTPLRETIEQMKRTMNDSTLKQTELSTAMKENLENMMKHSEAAKQSADELARVFKHKSKVQGCWGERVLEELLDSQGLKCGIHYERESVIRDAAGNVVTTDAGGNLRPDVILHLDTTREVIIDSKVSLTAFMDYVNAETDDERQVALKLHIDSIQKHVKELSKKDYSSYIQAPKQKMDYVIMFVPHTGALWTALNAQPDLWRKAMEMNVFIADEQTLFAALRMIHLTWTQIKQAENHQEVYKLANEMIKRVGMFLKNYETVGKALTNARVAYEAGEKKLLDRGQSIVQTCNKLEALGAKQSSDYTVPQIDTLE